MIMNRYLLPGDVFKVEKGMKVVTSVPEKYVFTNRLLSDKEVSHVVEIGKLILYNNEKYKGRREVCMIDLNTNLIQSFGYRASEERLAKAMNVLIPPFPCFDPYDTDYLIGDYIVDAVERSEIRVHNTDYGFEYCVKAHKVDCKSQKIEFAQTGISEALILPENITLLKEGMIYEQNSCGV